MASLMFRLFEKSCSSLAVGLLVLGMLGVLTTKGHADTGDEGSDAGLVALCDTPDMSCYKSSPYCSTIGGSCSTDPACVGRTNCRIAGNTVYCECQSNP